MIRPGIMFQMEEHTDWSILRIAIHYHEKEERDCLAYRGLILTVFGFSMFIGLVKI